ncbi:ketopantoate hydroxymethyltransferase [Paenibacillus motobuensis]|uniref:ketopantoate hydroxymethyltransferase n=1 Tax=Paenibacillus TaxID=44249 RepID=UPI00203AF457|nr:MULTISPECIES: ketopantoate hydroxymethyltransferase [Paenibacillus]MCM3040736.1 ketopantoate hydroxymethyltransferase [Paenibacillus lutimineralis]MCM3647840.1 ketopantoate hydroxymethyltransferase [Paenibacillus motobuensis]
MIASTFLSDIANYTNGKIAKVVLNDTVEIPSFTIKEVSGAMIAMQYIVPAALVTTVNKIELKDRDNNVISSNNVYVPIATDTLLLQNIQVKEVSA